MNRFGSGQRVSALGSRPVCGRAARAGRPGGRAAPVASAAAAAATTVAACLILSMVAVLRVNTAGNGRWGWSRWQGVAVWARGIDTTNADDTSAGASRAIPPAAGRGEEGGGLQWKEARADAGDGI